MRVEGPTPIAIANEAAVKTISKVVDLGEKLDMDNEVVDAFTAGLEGGHIDENGDVVPS